MQLDRTFTAEEADGWAETLAGEGGEAPGGDEALSPGTHLGRYLIVGRLGEGGMGVVYAGYDPELDRRVALKLLSSRVDSSEAARLRMLREAQAMARLQHPNVVTVHDVGTAGDRVWVAMEQVRGVTLRQWLAHGKRPWQQVIETMRAVARGLIAAHEAGLVHRDVKPENVMIGDDGRVRVMDFGLARAGGAALEPARLSVSGSSLLDSELTHAGSLIGTPLYMAPEGLLGATIDARADQFGWCVTCWEALYGERPFGGETLDALTRNVKLGKRRAPPPGNDVPGGVRRALERGLAVTPAGRHASMAALLAALDAALRARRWRSAAYVACAMSVGSGIVIGARQMQADADAEACVAAGAEIREVWGEEAAGRVAAAFAATGRADAAAMFARTRPWLDAYADAWASARTELCATTGGRAPTTGDEDARECLEERRASLDALVDRVLARADGETLTRVVSAASRLPQISLCRDATWLAHAPRRPADPTARGVVAELRPRLERVTVLERAGKYADAMTEADAALQTAEALGWSPLVAEARLRRGLVQMARAEYAAAEAELEAVVWQAETDGHDRLVAEAASGLIFAVGQGLGRPGDGIRWGRLALAVFHRIGEDGSLGAADALAALGIVEEARGEYEEASRLKAKMLAIRERHLGPDHPVVGGAYNMIGVNLFERGDLEGARQAHEHSLAIRLAALGPDHIDVASSYLNLGNVHGAQRASARALEYYEKARQIFAAVAGPEHPNTAAAIDNIAVCEGQLGQHAAALEHHRQAQAIRERSLGAGHPLVAIARAGIGDVLFATDDLAGAEVEYRGALEIFERAVGAEHPHVAVMLQKIGGTRRAAGDLAGAVASLERAWAIRQAREVPAPVAAVIDFKLGQALWESSRDRERARGLLLDSASRMLTEANNMTDEDASEIRGWLAAHEAELRPEGVGLRPAG